MWILKFHSKETLEDDFYLTIHVRIRNTLECLFKFNSITVDDYDFSTWQRYKRTSDESKWPFDFLSFLLQQSSNRALSSEKKIHLEEKTNLLKNPFCVFVCSSFRYALQMEEE